MVLVGRVVRRKGAYLCVPSVPSAQRFYDTQCGDSWRRRRLYVAWLKCVLSTAADGQHVNRFVFDGEDGPVGRARTETDQLVSDLVREVIVLGRESVALGKTVQHFDLIIDRV